MSEYISGGKQSVTMQCTLNASPEFKIEILTAQLAAKDAQINTLREDLDRSESTYRKCRDDMTFKDTQLKIAREALEKIGLMSNASYLKARDTANKALEKMKQMGGGE